MSITYYDDFLPPSLVQQSKQKYTSVPSVPGLFVDPQLLSEFSDIETPEGFSFVCALYDKVKDRLNTVLSQRAVDRAFCDAYTSLCVQKNKGVDFLSPEYQTVIGAKDKHGRIVVGPSGNQKQNRTVRIPDFLEGDQVTLFGPPDTEKMSINAMNSLHRALKGEDPLIKELVEESGQVPRWGADNEDSKTPVMRSFLHACRNLIGCYEGDLSFDDPRNGKQYRLTDSGRALPIKRIPGLALPDGAHIYNDQPLPLHLFDFAMHMFHNWNRPQSLIFYIPKLENEEEAAYIHFLIDEAETMLQKLHPSYQKGSVGLFIVFENPRAIFRIQEMADALYPYFVGGSLGWHDFLASTARLFKNDPNYRIPVKADPNIVINHIKESHLILKHALAPIGAISIGGMYGTLYEEGNPKSFEVCMVGYIKDVITQLKRGLDGFWVAHPNFVRIGIALVYAWRSWQKNPDDTRFDALIKILVPNPVEQEPLRAFVFGEDVDGLSPEDALYARGVLAADIEESELISNSDESELRYNIFQALQYITDWLCGNGCVALPAQITNAAGESVFVRIMDDLATTERSRWELWAEVYHKRVSIEEFRRLLHDEADFIEKDQERADKRIQVRWTGEAAKWYPKAVEMLDRLVTDEEPVEFVSQLLMRELYTNE